MKILLQCTNEGFALLAHELVHVLQYRREGFSDFVCHYWPTCGLAAALRGSCGLEQQAYMHQALVLEDGFPISIAKFWRLRKSKSSPINTTSHLMSLTMTW
jgi:Domain of unknown function (DUF4157)